MTLGLGRSRAPTHPVLGDDQQVLPIGGAPDVIADGSHAIVAVGPPTGDVGERVGHVACAAVDDSILDTIGGGTPKAMYLNYELMQAKKARGTLAKDEVQRERRLAIERFDLSPDLQRRWRALYEMKRRRRRRKESELPRGTDDEVEGRVAIWESSLQVEGEPLDVAPVAPSLLQEQHAAASGPALDDLVACPKRFTVESADADVVDHRARVANMWGCCNEWHNACVARLAAENKVRLFRSFQSRMNSWVDARRDTIKATEILVHFESAPEAGEVVLHTWALLSLAMFNPKVQCFARVGCPMAPAASQGPNGFVTVAVALPALFEICVGPSRICAKLADAAPFHSILFETGDELLQRLLCRAVWLVSHVEHHIDAAHPSLLRMVATTESLAEEWRWSNTVIAEDIVEAFLALPGSGQEAVERGLGQAEVVCFCWHVVVLIFINARGHGHRRHVWLSVRN